MGDAGAAGQPGRRLAARTAFDPLAASARHEDRVDSKACAVYPKAAPKKKLEKKIGLRDINRLVRTVDGTSGF
jgi:hypothetical protein